MLRYVPRPGRRELLALSLLVLEFIFFCFLTDNFATAGNLFNIVQNSTDLAIISIGMTLVIVSGGMDVSAGTALGVVAILIGRGIQSAWPAPVIVAGALALGAAIGTINGLIVTYGNISDMIATLGTMNIWRAVIFALLGGRWITGLPPVFSGLVMGKTAGIPNPVFLITAAYLVFHYITTYRPFGRAIYCVGNNREAAKLAGINVRLVKICTYSIMGALTGLAALFYIGRMGGVEITVGLDLGLRSVAAVIIGGTAMTGGRGSLIGTFIGVFFIETMRNGLVMLGVPSLWDRAIIGILIIVSVAVDLVFERRVARAQILGRAIGRQTKAARVKASV